MKNLIKNKHLVLFAVGATVATCILATFKYTAFPLLSWWWVTFFIWAPLAYVAILFVLGYLLIKLNK